MESFRAKAFFRKSCITVSSTICCQDLPERGREGGGGEGVINNVQLLVKNSTRARLFVHVLKSDERRVFWGFQTMTCGSHTRVGVVWAPLCTANCARGAEKKRQPGFRNSFFWGEVSTVARSQCSEVALYIGHTLHRLSSATISGRKSLDMRYIRGRLTVPCFISSTRSPAQVACVNEGSGAFRGASGGRGRRSSLAGFTLIGWCIRKLSLDNKACVLSALARVHGPAKKEESSRCYSL